MELTVREKIEALGGRSGVASLLKVRYTTVDYWYQEDRLPEWRVEVLDRHLSAVKPARRAKRKARAA